MKARAKQRMKKRRARFVVGYIRAGNILFGRKGYHTWPGAWRDCSIADPLTARQARELLAETPCADCAIFELVPVEVNR